MNLYHLQYFRDAAHAGGISQAAKKNFLSQSAVSRAIASLEQTLGVELVTHRQNHFQLTEAGEAILEKSESVFEIIARLKDTAASYAKTFRGPLRLGCNQAIAGRLLGPALTQIEAKYPHIKPQLKIGNTDQIQHMIDKQEIDFGVVVDDGEVNKIYQTKELYAGHFLIVKSPLFTQAKPFEHLIVSRTQKGGLSQKYLSEYQKAYGKTITPKLVVSSWQVIMDMAIAGYGIALVPEFLCEEAIRTKKLTTVPHRVKPIPFKLCTITSKNRSLPKNAEALFEAFGRLFK